MPDRAVISVHTAPDTAERLSRLSSLTRRSKSWLANEAIERYLAEEEAFLADVEEGRSQAQAGEGLTSAEAKTELRSRLTQNFGESGSSDT